MTGKGPMSRLLGGFLILLSSQFGYAAVDDWSGPLHEAQSLLAEEKYAEALKAFKQHSKDNGLAQFSIALFHQLGWGVSKNPKLACDWFARAADNQVPSAQQQLGLCYLSGEYKPGQENAALALFEQAYANGIKAAACQAGVMYVEGKHVTRQIAKGIRLCTEAASQGARDAQSLLGQWLFDGRYVEQNHEQACALLSEAANRNEPVAAFYLARIYDQGIERDQDLKLARYWYESSAQAGHIPAYLPTAALYWQAFSEQKEPAPDLLAKTYLWAKTTRLANDDIQVRQHADNILAQVAKHMPGSWQQDLDPKVLAHINKHVR